jgi:hypothetical protein
MAIDFSEWKPTETTAPVAHVEQKGGARRRKTGRKTGRKMRKSRKRSVKVSRRRR